jgi:predicted nucleotidyltransferase
MKVLGIVAEYNPFHNGHLYHLEESKKKSGCTHTVAIMSGSFLQRGEPALVDKWTRAHAAVKNGIDLVVELPYAYSCQSAEIFAYGAIRTLDETKSVDYIAFGSEAGDMSKLSAAAKILADEPEAFKANLKKNLELGLSFPKAREISLHACTPQISKENLISQPNNILALEYLKWIYRLSSNIQPMQINRIKVGYHSDFSSEGIASATHIRNLITRNSNWNDVLKPLVPKSTYNIILNYSKNQSFNTLDDYYEIIASVLLKSSAKEISLYPDVTEGLENRLLRSLKKSFSATDELIRDVSSKRYPSTRISRILCHLITNYKEADVDKFYRDRSYCPYLRILAFNANGRELINKIKNNSDMSVITNLGKSQKNLNPAQMECLRHDIVSTDIYFLKTDIKKIGSDYIQSPIYIKD